VLTVYEYEKNDPNPTIFSCNMGGSPTAWNSLTPTRDLAHQLLRPQSGVALV